jgi:hypothetical protein
MATNEAIISAIIQARGCRAKLLKELIETKPRIRSKYYPVCHKRSFFFRVYPVAPHQVTARKGKKKQDANDEGMTNTKRRAALVGRAVLCTPISDSRRIGRTRLGEQAA